MHGRPDRVELLGRHRQVGGLDGAHGAALVHDRVLLRVADHRVRDVPLARAVEELHASAARTASSKPAGCWLTPGGGGSVTSISSLQAVDQRPDEADLDRCHERDPVGGEAWREHGHGDHLGRPAPERLCRPADHVTVREDVGAAELDLRRCVVELPDVRERRRDVGDRDRLGARVEPARRDHHRQPLREVTEHLERGAALADDHRRPHVDQLGHPLGEQRGDLVAGAQVLRRAGVAEAAEVDHAPHARVARGLAEVHGGLAVARREALAAGAAAHGVDEVVGGAHAVERGRKAGALERVALPHVDLGGEPRAGGVADERAHPPAAAQELVQHVRSDVAGGAGEEDRFRVHRARYVPERGRDDPATPQVRREDGGRQESNVLWKVW